MEVVARFDARGGGAEGTDGLAFAGGDVGGANGLADRLNDLEVDHRDKKIYIRINAHARCNANGGVGAALSARDH